MTIYYNFRSTEQCRTVQDRNNYTISGVDTTKSTCLTRHQKSRL